MWESIEPLKDAAERRGGKKAPGPNEMSGSGMWREIVSFFKGSPAKLKVARRMVELGFGVDEEGKIICGGIEIPDGSMSRGAGVDRRVVRDAVKDIMENRRMWLIFSGMKPAGGFISDIAPALGYSVVEIRAKPDSVGVIARATALISEAGVSIRQILAEDPDLNPDPKLLIITEKRVPGDVVSKLLEIPTVTKVSIS